MLALFSVSRSAMSAAEWDRFVWESKDGWLFHTSLWIGANSEPSRDRSFAVVDQTGATLAIAAVRSEWTRIGMISIPRLYNARAGLAHAPGLSSELQRQVDAFALRKIESIGRRACALLVNWELSSMVETTGAQLEEELVAAGFTSGSYPSKVVDLALSEESLFAAARSRCRRDVRRAQRDGVQSAVAATVEDVALFARLHTQTMHAVGGAPSQEQAFQKLWLALAPGGHAEILIARSPSGNPAAGAMTLSYKGASYYHAAGTAPGEKQWGGNTLLVWESIVRARARGDKTFHLGITARREQVAEKAFTIGQFKSQFGGNEVAWRVANHTLWPGLGTLMKGAQFLRARALQAGSKDTLADGT